MWMLACLRSILVKFFSKLSSNIRYEDYDDDDDDDGGDGSGGRKIRAILFHV